MKVHLAGYSYPTKRFIQVTDDNKLQKESKRLINSFSDILRKREDRGSKSAPQVPNYFYNQSFFCE